MPAPPWPKTRAALHRRTSPARPFDEIQRDVRRVLEMEATYRLRYEGELPKRPKMVKIVSGKVPLGMDS